MTKMVESFQQTFCRELSREARFALELLNNQTNHSTAQAFSNTLHSIQSYIGQINAVMRMLNLHSLVVLTAQQQQLIGLLLERTNLGVPYRQSLTNSLRTLLSSLEHYQRGVEPDIEKLLFPTYREVGAYLNTPVEELHISCLYDLPEPKLPAAIGAPEPGLWSSWRQNFERYLLEWLKQDNSHSIEHVNTLDQISQILDSVLRYEHPARRAFWVARGLCDPQFYLSLTTREQARLYLGRVAWLFRHVRDEFKPLLERFEREVLFFLKKHSAQTNEMGSATQRVLLSYGLTQTHTTVMSSNESPINQVMSEFNQTIANLLKKIQDALTTQNFESAHQSALQLKRELTLSAIEWRQLAGLLCEITLSDKLKQAHFYLEFSAAVNWFTHLWQRQQESESTTLLLSGIDALIWLRDQGQAHKAPWTEIITHAPILDEIDLTDSIKRALELLSQTLDIVANKANFAQAPRTIDNLLKELGDILRTVANQLERSDLFIPANTVRKMIERLHDLVSQGDVALEFTKSLSVLRVYVHLLAEGQTTARIDFLENDGLILQNTPDELQPLSQSSSTVNPISASTDDFLDIFYQEAASILQELIEILTDVDINYTILIPQCARLLHTLKGSGRMLGLDPFSNGASILEQEVHNKSVESEDLRFRFYLLQCVDLLNVWLDAHQNKQDLPTLNFVYPHNKDTEHSVLQLNTSEDITDSEPSLESSLTSIELAQPNLPAQEDGTVARKVANDNFDETESCELVEFSDPTIFTKAASVAKTNESKTWVVNHPSNSSSENAELLSLFCAEFEEALSQLEMNLTAWKDGDSDQKQDILGTLHRIKGSAGVAGVKELVEHVHNLESALLQTNDVSVAEQGIANISKLFFSLTNVERRTQLHLLNHNEQTNASNTTAQVDAGTIANQSTLNTTSTLAPQTQHRQNTPDETAQEIKVQLKELSRLSNELQEVSIKRTQLAEQTKEIFNLIESLQEGLTDLESLGRDVELALDHFAFQAGRTERRKELPNSPFQAHEMDEYLPFQEKVRTLNGKLSEFTERLDQTRTLAPQLDQMFFGLQQQIRGLQVDFVSLRLIPIGSISQRLSRAIHYLASSLNKQVELRLTGSKVMIDQTVVMVLIPILEHLMRNAVWHGIETPAVREKLGKPAKGQINLDVYQKDTRFYLRVSDDGAGLNLEKISQIAQQRGLILPDETASKHQIESLVFMPNLSTETTPNEYAGHGIGLDFVRKQVSALGGSIQVESEKNKGVQFTISLPNHQFSMRALLIMVADQQHAIPTHLLDCVLPIESHVIPQLLEQGFMMYQDTHLPVVDLASLLELGNAQVSSSSQLLLVNTVTQPIALHVPKIIGYSELIMRPVSSPISLIPGILGAAVLSSGHPVLLLDPFFMWMNQRSQSAQTLNETFSFTQNTKTGFNHNEDSFVSDASNSPEKQFLDPQKTSGVVNDVHAALTAGGLMAIVQEEQSPKSIASTEEPGMDPLNSILLKTTNNEHEPSSGEAPLILVVDDSATVRHVTKMLLQKQNYRVELASDGLEAWEKLKTIMPAVILLDIEMPKWDGFRLTQAIREDERLKEIPVVMISSRSAQKHSAHAKTIGADMFIGKPFPEDTVLSFVRRAVLNGRRGLKKD